jgi:hypothetical protein
MVISARHLVATRANLRIAHERQYDKALREEEYGSCRRCEEDSLDLPSCKECINGGGKKKLFRSKKRKRRQHSKRRQSK